MNIPQWWALVQPETRTWLIQHNGEALPPDITADIMAANGGTTDSAWWDGDPAEGPRLSDAAVDWVEAVANDEEPPPG